MQATLSSKGQLTIPRAVRDQLGLKPGMKLEIGVERGALVARRSTEATLANLRKWYGKGKDAGKKTTEQLMREMRGDHRD